MAHRSIVDGVRAAAGPGAGPGATETVLLCEGGRPARVLSIQSHVVSGYVGNKSATLPLQLLGFDVDPVMSVQFSNHTGYPAVRGKAFDGAHLAELLEGLETNGLVQHTHLLTGYIGTLSLLEAIANVARALRAANPSLTYVCDPVLGDEGKCYVGEQLIEGYRSTIVPLASCLTPNQFEAELLSGLPVVDVPTALTACDALHDMGPHTVVITSLEDSSGSPGGSGGGGGEQQPAAGGGGGSGDGVGGCVRRIPGGFITLVASTRQEQLPGRPKRFRIDIPKMDAYFTGTGDLLAALLLAWTARLPGDLAAATEKALGGLQGVLRVTAAEVARTEAATKAKDHPLSSKERSAAVFRAKELRLVQARHVLENPTVELFAQPL